MGRSAGGARPRRRAGARATRALPGVLLPAAAVHGDPEPPATFNHDHTVHDHAHGPEPAPAPAPAHGTPEHSHTPPYQPGGHNTHHAQHPWPGETCPSCYACIDCAPCACVSPTSSPIRPSRHPTMFPTKGPTAPTRAPTIFPSMTPTMWPTSQPPTRGPTGFPTTRFPTVFPTRFPTLTPTKPPSRFPTVAPTEYPSGAPDIVSVTEWVDVMGNIAMWGGPGSPLFLSQCTAVVQPHGWCTASDGVPARDGCWKVKLWAPNKASWDAAVATFVRCATMPSLPPLCPCGVTAAPLFPTAGPSRAPASTGPSRPPSARPSLTPSSAPPSVTPSGSPSAAPSGDPTGGPTIMPTTTYDCYDIYCQTFAVQTSQRSVCMQTRPRVCSHVIPPRVCGPPPGPGCPPSLSPQFSPDSLMAPTRSPSRLPSMAPTQDCFDVYCAGLLLDSYCLSGTCPTCQPRICKDVWPPVQCLCTDSPSLAPTSPTRSPSATPSRIPTSHPTVYTDCFDDFCASRYPGAQCSRPKFSCTLIVPPIACSCLPSFSPLFAPNAAPSRSPITGPSVSPTPDCFDAYCKQQRVTTGPGPSYCLAGNPRVCASILPPMQCLCTSPSREPSRAPSTVPSGSPSTNPTSSPSTVPTEDYDCYDKYCDTEYPGSRCDRMVTPNSCTLRVPPIGCLCAPSLPPIKAPNTSPTTNPAGPPSISPTVDCFDQYCDSLQAGSQCHENINPRTCSNINPPVQCLCTYSPSASPVRPTTSPSSSPTTSPSDVPTTSPTSSPSTQPSSVPTMGPTNQDCFDAYCNTEQPGSVCLKNVTPSTCQGIIPARQCECCNSCMSGTGPPVVGMSFPPTSTSPTRAPSRDCYDEWCEAQQLDTATYKYSYGIATGLVSFCEVIGNPRICHGLTLVANAHSVACECPFPSTSPSASPSASPVSYPSRRRLLQVNPIFTPSISPARAPRIVPTRFPTAFPVSLPPTNHPNRRSPTVHVHPYCMCPQPPSPPPPPPPPSPPPPSPPPPPPYKSEDDDDSSIPIGVMILIALIILLCCCVLLLLLFYLLTNKKEEEKEDSKLTEPMVADPSPSPVAPPGEDGWGGNPPMSPPVYGAESPPPQSPPEPQQNLMSPAQPPPPVSAPYVAAGSQSPHYAPSRPSGRRQRRSRGVGNSTIEQGASSSFERDDQGYPGSQRQYSPPRVQSPDPNEEVYHVHAEPGAHVHVHQ